MSEVDYQRLPYVHIALINATCLSSHAFRPLLRGKSSWERVLELIDTLPQKQLEGETKIPKICLLPPKEEEVFEVLAPEELEKAGLLYVYLQERSESALLLAVQQAIEMVYPQAFRPDPILQSLEKVYKEIQQRNSEEEPSSEKLHQERLLDDMGLPLGIRYPMRQLERKQLLQKENLTSRQIHCYWIQGDSPMLSRILCEQMYQNHHKFAAELSFADAYPVGLCPVLFQANILARLWPLIQPKVLKRHSWFQIAGRDFNRFAAEPLISDVDYRLLRLELAVKNKRQFNIVEKLYLEKEQNGGLEDWKDILSFIKGPNVVGNEPEWIRSLPRYFPIQISALCPQTCSYCPYPKLVSEDFFPPKSLELAEKAEEGPAFMSRDLWRKLLAAIVDFAEDAVINLSPLGEALMHPEIQGFVEDLRRYPSLELVIETSGAYWREENIAALLRLEQQAGRPMITWILGLDALDAKLYQKLRNPSGEIQTRGGLQEKAHKLADLLLEQKASVYVQAVRMEENEQDLEAFYHHWKEKKAQVIIQKYNSYAGFLPQKQPVNLEPVERFACRRLAREMVFGLKGEAFLCIQDLQQRLGGNLGAFPQKSLEELWEQGKSLYSQHTQGAFPGICGTCDEYYVYNY